MNLLILYLLLTKATLTSFSGSTAIPIIRQDLVEHYHVLTDRQLNAAVAAGQTTPGPNGLFVVSVGYFVGGVAGGGLGLLAMVTPSFLIIPMLQFLGRRAEHPAVKSAVRTVTIAAASLVLGVTIPMGRAALTGILPALVALGSFLFLVLTKRATAWVILAAALVGLVGSLIS